MEEKQIVSAGSPENFAQPMAELRADNDRFCAANGTRRGAFVLTLGCQQNEFVI